MRCLHASFGGVGLDADRPAPPGAAPALLLPRRRSCRASTPEGAQPVECPSFNVFVLPWAVTPRPDGVAGRRLCTVLWYANPHSEAEEMGARSHGRACHSDAPDHILYGYWMDMYGWILDNRQCSITRRGSMTAPPVARRPLPRRGEQRRHARAHPPRGPALARRLARQPARRPPARPSRRGLPHFLYVSL